MTHELPGSEEALMKRVCGKSGKDLDGTSGTCWNNEWWAGWESNPRRPFGEDYEFAARADSRAEKYKSCVELCISTRSRLNPGIPLHSYPQNPYRYPYFLWKLCGTLAEAASTSLPINRFKISDLEDICGRCWNSREALQGGRQPESNRPGSV
jgi:hypothetical protein